MKIKELTPQEKIELVKFREESLKFGRSIEPINHEKCEKIISKFYERIGEKKPVFLYFSSPLMCILAGKTLNTLSFENLKINKDIQLRGQLLNQLLNQLYNQLYNQLESKLYSQLRNQLDWQYLNNYFAGQQWIYWQSYYKFCQLIGTKYTQSEVELLDEWMDEGKNLHWWFPFKGLVLISERPIRLTTNNFGQLHNESEKALEYSDGWGFYYLNGVSVPEELVKTPSENLSIEFFKNEKNADVKAEFVRKFGVERMLDFGTKIDDYTKYPNTKKYEWWHKSEYALYDMKNIFPGLDYQPYLKMTNITTQVFHVEAVSPNCRTIGHALRERFNGRDFKIKAIA